MLTRVDLTPEQTATLRDAVDHEGDGRLDLEMATNIVISVDSFLSTRYLPLPRIPAHFNIPGEERDYDIALFKSDEGYVLFQQATSDCGRKISGAHTIETNIVVGSQLDFMPEKRTEGWPLRVRRMMLDVVQWQLEQGRGMTDREKKKFRLWQELDNPLSKTGFFGNHLQGVRAVIAGRDTTHALWDAWAQDEPRATREFNDCRQTGQILRNLISRMPGRGP